MERFMEVVRGIYRLKIPFETIYTSVFLVLGENKLILVDCASSSSDVDEYIVPALSEKGYTISDVDVLVLTHRHGDHSGGKSRILSLSPNIEVVTTARQLCDDIYTYPLAGHTKDCIGVLDMRTCTLISGDGLQGAGVDRFRCYTEDRSAYEKTLAAVRQDARIENIIFSHAYEPWKNDVAIGRDAVDSCVSACFDYATNR